jgi:hypothetical protein
MKTGTLARDRNRAERIFFSLMFENNSNISKHPLRPAEHSRPAGIASSHR